MSVSTAPPPTAGAAAGRHSAEPTTPAESTLNGGRGPRRILRSAAMVVLLVALGLAGFEVGTGRWHATPVLSGSMRPGVQPGDVVITQRVPVSDLHVRDVIVFQPPDSSELRVHRIVALSERAGAVVITTRGDANTVNDPGRTKLAGTTAYRVVRVVPLLGYPAVWMHDGGQSYLIILVGLIVVLAALPRLWRALHANRTGPGSSREGSDGETAERNRMT